MAAPATHSDPGRLIDNGGAADRTDCSADLVPLGRANQAFRAGLGGIQLGPVTCCEPEMADSAGAHLEGHLLAPS